MNSYFVSPEDLKYSAKKKQKLILKYFFSSGNKSDLEPHWDTYSYISAREWNTDINFSPPFSLG